MVFFKLSQSIVKLVKKARLENLVGCQIYCDRQYISYSDLDQVVQKLQYEFKEAKEHLSKREQQKQKKEEALKSMDKDKLRQVELSEFMHTHQSSKTTDTDGLTLSSLSYEELAALVEDLKNYETLDCKDIAQKEEIVFVDWHMCNDNLKKQQVVQSKKKKAKAKDSDDEEELDDRGRIIRKDETFILKPEAIIAKNDKNKKTLEALEKVSELRSKLLFQVYGEDPDVKKARLESNQVMLEQIRNKIETKKYKLMTKDMKFASQDDDYEQKQKQEFRFTLAFGFGFISLMFLSFICGYFLGKKIMGLSETGSLIMSLVIGTGTIIMETILFLIRMEKLDQQDRKQKSKML